MAKTMWPANHEAYLRANYLAFTNPQLAKYMKVGLTVLRNELARLGLKRMVMEKWSKRQIAFLKANYKTMGDTEIATKLNELFPLKEKGKPWDNKRIRKKREYLELKRTPKQVEAIRTKNKAAEISQMAETNKKTWRRIRRYQQMGMTIRFTRLHLRMSGYKSHTKSITTNPLKND